MTEVKDDYTILQEMAEEVSKLLVEMSIIQTEKATSILMIKSEVGTWKEAEYKFASTSSGKREIELEFLLRGYKERMSALRNKINSYKSY
jgi:hypothetical protein